MISGIACTYRGRGTDLKARRYHILHHFLHNGLIGFILCLNHDCLSLLRRQLRQLCSQVGHYVRSVAPLVVGWRFASLVVVFLVVTIGWWQTAPYHDSTYQSPPVLLHVPYCKHCTNSLAMSRLATSRVYLATVPVCSL